MKIFTAVFLHFAVLHFDFPLTIQLCSAPTHEPGSTREPEPVDEVQNELEEGEADEEAEGAAHGGEDPAQVEHLVLGVHCDVAALNLGGEPTETWVAVQ